MYILTTHQSKQRCPYNIAYMHVGKNIGTGMLVLLTSVNLLGFKSQEIPTFSSYIYWFTRNYKDLTDCNLPNSPRVVSAPQGGYSNFFRIRRLGPSIYRSPQKNIRNFKHPKKIFEILATQKNIPILYLDLKKRP